MTAFATQAQTSRLESTRPPFTMPTMDGPIALQGKDSISHQLMRNASMRRLEREYVLVWRTLRRMGVERGDVEDATQDCFLAFAKRIRDVQAGRERSFLMGVCSRTAANFRRRAARRSHWMFE